MRSAGTHPHRSRRAFAGETHLKVLLCCKFPVVSNQLLSLEIKALRQFYRYFFSSIFFFYPGMNNNCASTTSLQLQSLLLLTMSVARREVVFIDHLCNTLQWHAGLHVSQPAGWLKSLISAICENKYMFFLHPPTPTPPKLWQAYR